MSNPLFKNQNQNLTMINKFNEFRKSLKGKDVQAIYNQTINSGRYTPEQIEKAKQMANQFKGLL